MINQKKILDEGFNKKTLNSLKSTSAQDSGKDYKEVMKETKGHFFKKIDDGRIVKEYEPL
jgi:hypothetical protein